jgi:hypothetical protein
LRRRKGVGLACRRLPIQFKYYRGRAVGSTSLNLRRHRGGRQHTFTLFPPKPHVSAPRQNMAAGKRDWARYLAGGNPPFLGPISSRFYSYSTLSISSRASRRLGRPEVKSAIQTMRSALCFHFRLLWQIEPTSSPLRARFPLPSSSLKCDIDHRHSLLPNA